MSGSDTARATGVYGTMSTASTNNTPGARAGSVSWTDSSGNLWLFAGNGVATSNVQGAAGELNDLWEFSPLTNEWTWIGGSNTASILGKSGVSGVYGTQGVASVNNIPGPRDSAVAWTDNNGNFWLFGGSGFTSPTTSGFLNDLWEFSPTTKQWTWVSGGNTIDAKGVYGTQGISYYSNVPGARGSGAGGASVSWTDSNGNLWLFGGEGLDSNGSRGYLNDVWEFSTATKLWTWISGSNTANPVAVYGTQGIGSSSNTPGGRSYSVGWADKSGKFWLYGGEGVAANYDLSDLWEFNPTTNQWTWVSGSNAGGVQMVYGTQGVAASTNTPGGRDSAVAWTDSSGNLWLFGGGDYDTVMGTNGTNEYLNDLWEFNPSTKQWTWVGGSSTGNAQGIYGTLGSPSTSNVPGARGSEGIPVTWVDSSGNFWLFGGSGYDSTGASAGLLNDLWRYQP